MIMRGWACILIGLGLSVLPAAAAAQAFEPGSAVAEAWSAFVEAQNAEDGPRAAQRIETVVGLVEARYGRDSAEMARVLGFRATALQRVGRVDEAEAAARDALAIGGRIHGADSVEAIDAANTLAVVYLADRGGDAAQRARFAGEAVRLLRDAIARLPREAPGAGATLETLRNSLIAAYGVLGRQDEAIAVHAQILEARASTGGADDPMVRSATLNLAQAYISAQRLEEAEALLEPLLTRLRGAGNDAAPALANALSAYALATMFPDRREAARREAVALYHRLGCRDPDVRRANHVARGGVGYPWSGSDADCPGDLRLAREIAGFRGLAYVARVKDPPQMFGSVRLLAHGSDVVIGNTRMRYARDQEARAAFGRLRYVHREFVTTAWEAGAR
jgi:tetratricopeptide (TPR) repeat protein